MRMRRQQKSPADRARRRLFCLARRKESLMGLLGRVERNAAGLSPEARRIRGARRAEIWQKQVRPLALTMMLLGPGLGLGMSTLVGALGMGSLGDAMGMQAAADVLAQTMARAY